jgi:hypothetical protein
MRLSQPISLSSPVTQADVLDIANVRKSTLGSSELAVLRFGKISPTETLPWIIKSTGLELVEEFKRPRIVSRDRQGPGVVCEEHLVVRDLDLPQTHHDEPTDATNEHTQEGTIVAHAQWIYSPLVVAPESETSPSTEGTHPANPPPSGANIELIKHFGQLIDAAINEMKKDISCYELRNISTAASHLRKGIAKQLTLWIVPYADRDNLPVILAASPLGYNLYRSCGFEDATDEKGESLLCSIDMEKWGGSGMHHHRLMVRWPSNWAGPRNWQQFKNSVKAASV